MDIEPSTTTGGTPPPTATHLRTVATTRRAPAFEWFAAPSASVLLLVLFQLGVWGVLCAVLAVAPPDDSLEQVLLSQELRFEYGKHPPMPTWLLYAVNQLAGTSISATYVLGAACAAATVLLLYAFARPLVGAGRAALAAILLSNVEYLNAGTAYFNHNTVQLPLALLAIVLFHRALTRQRWHDWALFGVGCGLMMLTKFSAVVLFASFAAYLIWTRRLLDPAIARGLALATLVAMTLITPYLLAVRNDPWSPEAYAVQAIFPPDWDRVQGLKSVWGFASSQLAKVLPALLVFALLPRGARALPRDEPNGVSLTPFLTVVGFGPFVLTVVVAAATGASLLVGWGTTFHVLLTLWLVQRPRWSLDTSPRALRRATLASIALQIGLCALVSTHGGRLPNLNPTPHPVATPTPSGLGNAVLAAWQRHCAIPLQYVLTDGHTGAALAVGLQGRPRVVDATRPESAKFFPDDDRLANGAMVVMRRAPTTSTSTSTSTEPAPDAARPLDQFMDDTSWRSTIQLPAGDGRLQPYDIGVLRPTVVDGCG